MSAAEIVDPTIEPGSYEMTKTGFRRTDTPTKPSDTPFALMDPELARSTAAAIEASGFPAPPGLQASIDQPKGAPPSEPTPAVIPAEVAPPAPKPASAPSTKSAAPGAADPSKDA